MATPVRYEYGMQSGMNQACLVVVAVIVVISSLLFLISSPWNELNELEERFSQVRLQLRMGEN